MLIDKILVILISGLLLSCSSHQDKNAVIISTDKSDYSIDEKIKITVINKLDSTIFYSKSVRCGASFFELNDCKENHIFYHNDCRWVTYQHGFSELGPYDTLIGYWYQDVYIDFEPQNAIPGCYKFVFPYFIKKDNENLRTWNEEKRITYSNEFKLE